MFDFLNKPNSPLAERARSPLYGSFIISWLIWNWKIILTLFFFKEQDFKGLNVVQYICDNYLNWDDSLWIPLIITVVYIFIVPWIDYFIIWYSEINKREKIDRKIKIGRKHYVEGALYYDLRLKYEAEKNKIVDFEVNLSKAKAEALEAQNKLKQKVAEAEVAKTDQARAEIETRDIGVKLAKLEKRHQLDGFFKGRWLLVSEVPDFNGVKPSTQVGQQLDIRGNEMFVIDNNKDTKICNLELINFDPDKQKLEFLKYSSDRNGQHIMSKLNIISNDRLEGTENYQKVTYTRNKLVLEIKNETYDVN